MLYISEMLITFVFRKEVTIEVSMWIQCYKSGSQPAAGTGTGSGSGSVSRCSAEGRTVAALTPELAVNRGRGETRRTRRDTEDQETQVSHSRVKSTGRFWSPHYDVITSKNIQYVRSVRVLLVYLV